MNALITGQSGFAGQHLTALLIAEGIEVVGFNLGEGRDVRDYECLRECLTTCAPDLVFHLAAQPSPAESWGDPRRALDIIVDGAFNLLEAARHTDSHARLLLVGSEAEYGAAMRLGRVTEDGPCFPVSPYGTAKLAATNLAMNYHHQHGLQVVVARPSYHTGPGQHPRFAISAFARRVVLAERGLAPHVRHGDLTASRAILDVRDVAAAYRAAIDLDAGVYNVSGDLSISMQAVLVQLTDIAAVPIVTKPDDTLGRNRDTTPWWTPSHEKLTRACGWEPRIGLPQTLTDLLDDWRARL